MIRQCYASPAVRLEGVFFKVPWRICADVYSCSSLPRGIVRKIVPRQHGCTLSRTFKLFLFSSRVLIRHLPKLLYLRPAVTFLVLSGGEHAESAVAEKHYILTDWAERVIYRFCNDTACLMLARDFFPRRRQADERTPLNGRPCVLK